MPKESARNTDRLEYIYSMLGQLRGMADSDGHHMLAYLVDMSRTEASDMLRRARPSHLRRDQGDSAA